MFSRALHIALLAGLIAILFVGCGGTAVTELTAPSDARCPITVGSLPAVPFTGGQTNTSVSTARECSWSATSEASWIEVTPLSGQGNGLITLTVRENDNTADRTGAIALNGQARLTVTQQAAPPPPPPPAEDPTPAVDVTPHPGPAPAPAPAPCAPTGGKGDGKGRDGKGGGKDDSPTDTCLVSF